MARAPGCDPVKAVMALFVSCGEKGKLKMAWHHRPIVSRKSRLNRDGGCRASPRYRRGDARLTCCCLLVIIGWLVAGNFNCGAGDINDAASSMQRPLGVWRREMRDEACARRLHVGRTSTSSCCARERRTKIVVARAARRIVNESMAWRLWRNLLHWRGTRAMSCHASRISSPVT